MRKKRIEKYIKKFWVWILVLIVFLGFILCYFVGNLNILRFTQRAPIETGNFFSKYKNGGKNVKIAILDSGVNRNHQDFSDNIKEGYDFITGGKYIDDTFGHGTWVTGLIAADNNNIGICGIAPRAEIYPLVVLDKDGKGKIDNVVNAIYWCIDNKMDIINISFATQKNNDNLSKAIDKAIQKGIIIVASYNNNENKMSYPAQYKNVIGVKTKQKVNKIYIQDEICYAPGYDIITTNKKGGYERVKGNSIATAYVTGSVALIISECKTNKDIYNVNVIKEKINEG